MIIQYELIKIEENAKNRAKIISLIIWETFYDIPQLLI